MEFSNKNLLSLASNIGNNFKVLYTTFGSFVGCDTLDLKQVPAVKPDFSKHSNTDLDSAIKALNAVEKNKQDPNLQFALQAKMPKDTYDLTISFKNNEDCHKMATSVQNVLKASFIQITHPSDQLNAIKLQVFGHGNIKQMILNKTGQISLTDISNRPIIIGDEIISDNFSNDDTVDLATAFANLCANDNDFFAHRSQIVQDTLNKKPKEIATQITSYARFAKLGVNDNQDDDDPGHIQGFAFKNTYGIKSNEDLINLLRYVSRLWRKHHYNKRTKKSGKMEADDIEYYLKKYEPMCKEITNNTQRLFFYDWDTHTYIADPDKLDNMIMTVAHNKVSLLVKKDILTGMINSDDPQIPIKVPIEVEAERNGTWLYKVFAKNGIYDINTKHFTPYNQNIFCTRHTETDLDLNESLNTEPYLGDIDPVTGKKLTRGWWHPMMLIDDLSRDDDNDSKIRPDVKHALLQACRCAVTGNGNTQQMMLMFESHGWTGKSTLLQLIKNIIGAENAGTLSIDDMRDQNTLATDADKMLLISDENDINSRSKKLLQAFKKAVSGDFMTMKFLYQNKFSDRLHGFIFNAANEEPLIKNADGGFYRRLVLIKIEHQLPRDDDSKLKAGKELTKVKNNFINNSEVIRWFYWYLITQVKPCARIDEPKESKALKQGMQLDSDSVAAFVEYFVKGLKSKFITNDFLYTAYENFATYENADKDDQDMGMRTFLRRLRDNQWFKEHYKPTHTDVKGKWNSDDGKAFDELASKVGYSKKFTSLCNPAARQDGKDPYEKYGQSTKSQRGFMHK